VGRLNDDGASGKMPALFTAATMTDDTALPEEAHRR
jgi:hypothetical protein